MLNIRIGTRKSPLALVQANWVRDQLLAAWPGISVELVHVVTSGDKFTDRPLADIGGKGLFTKEIEDMLLARQVDLAVHSVKDMQTVLPDGLIIGCMPEREDPRDVLVGAARLADIPKGGTFGTSSLRRAAQVLIKRPDLKIVPLRGNVETRLAKVDKGEMDATLLALAGLKRLKLLPPLWGEVGRGGVENIPPSLTLPHKGGGNIFCAPLAVSELLPAVGQGALGIECREGDKKILDLLQPLSHKATETAVHCERAFLRALDGSCRTPIAGYATVTGSTLHFEGLLAEADGSKHKRITQDGVIHDAEKIGRAAGEALRKS